MRPNLYSCKMAQLIRAFMRTKVRAFRSVMLKLHGSFVHKLTRGLIFCTSYFHLYQVSLIVTRTYSRWQWLPIIICRCEAIETCLWSRRQCIRDLCRQIFTLSLIILSCVLKNVNISFIHIQSLCNLVRHWRLHCIGVKQWKGYEGKQYSKCHNYLLIYLQAICQ